MSAHKGPVSLVLSGGGARAAYQVGVLKYFAEQTDQLPFQIITGSSAGSLNAAVLAQHAPDFRQGVAHLEEIWTNLTTQQVYIAKALPLTWGLIKGLIQFLRAGKGRKIRQLGLFDSSPLMDLINRNMNFEKLHNKLEEGHLRALAITATGYSMPFTTTFCSGNSLRAWIRPGRVGVPTRVGPLHLLASSSLPFLFPAVRIHEAYFGDGSMRQTHPLAPSIHLGARRILAIGLRKKSQPQLSALETKYPPPSLAEVLGTIFNGIFLDGFEADGRHLSLINRVLDQIPEENISQATMELHTDHTLRKIGLNILTPSEDLGKLALDFLDSPPWTISFLMRGLGHKKAKSADFASYLLFEGSYAKRLIEMGYRDGQAQWAQVEPFLFPREKSRKAVPDPVS